MIQDVAFEVVSQRCMQKLVFSCSTATISAFFVLHLPYLSKIISQGQHFDCRSTFLTSRVLLADLQHCTACHNDGALIPQAC